MIKISSKGVFFLLVDYDPNYVNYDLKPYERPEFSELWKRLKISKFCIESNLITSLIFIACENNFFHLFKLQKKFFGNLKTFEENFHGFLNKNVTPCVFLTKSFYEKHLKEHFGEFPEFKEKVSFFFSQGKMFLNYLEKMRENPKILSSKN